MGEGLGQGLDEIDARRLGGADAGGFDRVAGKAVGLGDGVDFKAILAHVERVAQADLIVAPFAGAGQRQIAQRFEAAVAGGVAPENPPGEIEPPQRIGAIAGLGDMGEPGEHLQPQFMAL